MSSSSKANTQTSNKQSQSSDALRDTSQIATGDQPVDKSESLDKSPGMNFLPGQKKPILMSNPGEDGTSHAICMTRADLPTNGSDARNRSIRDSNSIEIRGARNGTIGVTDATGNTTRVNRISGVVRMIEAITIATALVTSATITSLLHNVKIE